MFWWKRNKKFIVATFRMSFIPTSTATAAATTAAAARCVLHRNQWKRFFRSTICVSSSDCGSGSSDGRLDGVIMHPESIGKEILPGGHFVSKLDTRSGEYRQVLVERNFGSFLDDEGTAKSEQQTNSCVVHSCRSSNSHAYHRRHDTVIDERNG